MIDQRSNRSLCRVLWADAASCVGCGLFMLSLAQPFGQLVRLPPELLFYAGLVLLPLAAFIATVAARASQSAPAIGVIIAGNLAWGAASLWLLLGGISAPTTLGYLFIAAQAAVVLTLAVLEVRGLQRLTQEAPA